VLCTRRCATMGPWVLRQLLLRRRTRTLHSWCYMEGASRYVPQPCNSEARRAPAFQAQHSACLPLSHAGLQVDLPQLLPFMKGLAADPMPPVGCGTRVSMGPQAAALLRFKEATQVHSCLAR
jgi:hypothetical protein